PCTRYDALIWFMEGYFNGNQLFALRRTDGKEGQWRTLDQLIARNGADMPFLELPVETEGKRGEEEEEEIRKERAELRQRGLLMRREVKCVKMRIVPAEYRICEFPVDSYRKYQAHSLDGWRCMC
ncbi:hypothetical protein PMAYCL1PPCAC_08142, partial [Pristionchus mayeri]